MSQNEREQLLAQIEELQLENVNVVQRNQELQNENESLKEQNQKLQQQVSNITLIMSKLGDVRDNILRKLALDKKVATTSPQFKAAAKVLDQLIEQVKEMINSILS